MATDIKNDATLSTSLISHWELEEESGTRADSHGSNTLADNNTVLFGTGARGNAADFELDNAEFLSIALASQTGLNVAGDISISAWVKFETLDDTQVISKQMETGGAVAWEFGFDSNLLRFFYSDGTNATVEHSDAAAVASTGVWYHVMVTADVSAKDVKLYVDGSLVSSSIILGNSVSMMSITTGGHALGADQYNSRYYFDGLIDEVSVWSKISTAAEVTSMYNLGTPLPYNASVTFVPTMQIIM